MTDLTIRPDDNDEVRALKYLLTYGDHQEGCDRSNEDGPGDEQHLCCACRWCLTKGWAALKLLGL